jgi:2-phosphoglycolate phosphatase
MIRAVAFDLDGTLIDSTDAIVRSAWHTFDVLGEPRPSREAIVRTIGHPLEEQFGLLTGHDPHECARIYRERYGEICRAMTTLVPGAMEMLEALAEAGLDLGFVTSKRRQFAEWILEHLGVLGFFRVRIGPDDVARPKPQPDPILRALDLFGVPAEAMRYVGDMDFDVLACRAAGVRCVAVTTGYADRAELEALRPEIVLDTLREVATYLLARANPRDEPARSRSANGN